MSVQTLLLSHLALCSCSALLSCGHMTQSERHKFCRQLMHRLIHDSTLLSKSKISISVAISAILTPKWYWACTYLIPYRYQILQVSYILTICSDKPQILCFSIVLASVPKDISQYINITFIKKSQKQIPSEEYCRFTLRLLINIFSKTTVWLKKNLKTINR